MNPTPPEAARLVSWWRAAGARGDWFAHRPAFDRAFRECWLTWHEQAAAGHCDTWINSPEGALALIILLDQFPRNAFRNSARMYATDPAARTFAGMAEALGHWAHLDTDLRLFLALPFSHSEDPVDQQTSLRLNRRLGQPWLSHAKGHHDIIRRFGRFPHRNAILGRISTAEEIRFLRNGGFAG